MSKRSYSESQRLPYRDYQRSRYNKSVGYAFDAPLRSAYSGPRRFVPYQKAYRARRYYGRSGSRFYKSLHIEKKFFDTDCGHTVDRTGEVPTGGQFCLIPQGVTESTRIGRVCQIKSLQVHASVTYIPGADTTGSALCYVYLVQDKQANGAAAAVTDVLTTTSLEQALINMSNSERFRIVRRFTYALQSGAGVSAAYGQDVQAIDEYVKLDMPVEFSAATGAITELKSNNLFWITGLANNSGDDVVTIAGRVRVRFTDI